VTRESGEGVRASSGRNANDLQRQSGQDKRAAVSWWSAGQADAGPGGAKVGRTLAACAWDGEECEGAHCRLAVRFTMSQSRVAPRYDDVVTASPRGRGLRI
jgi:hypothetical protein